MLGYASCIEGASTLAARIGGQEVILELKRCEGKLTRGQDSLDLHFDLTVDQFGKVAIQFAEIPLTKASGFLFDLIHDDGDEDSLPSLSGLHPDGVAIVARFLQTEAHESRSNHSGTHFGARMQTRDLRLTKESGVGPRSAHRLEYIFPRFKCFRADPPVETADGCYSVVGETDIDDHRELGGVVIVELPSAWQPNLDAYDDRVNTLLDFLSLASGRLLRWSVRKHFDPSGQLLMKFRGNQAHGDKGLALFPYLHLRPAIEAALTRISVDDHRRLGLSVATSWTLMNSQFDEANFQGMMTALEHLIHVGLPDDGKASLFPREQFRAIRPMLDEALRTVLASCGVDRNDSRIDVLLHRVRGQNYKPFKAKIEAYLDFHGVPAQDLLPSLASIVDLRNQVVHQGLAGDYRDGSFREAVDSARELLARIFMTHLRYSGPYESFLGGYSTKQFGITQS